MLTRLLAVLALAITPLAASRDLPNQNHAQPPQEPHWAIKLGMRVHAVDQAFPLVDRVVLVPDAATYVDELKKWSPRGRWPVLIEDDHFAPMFIRRFAPSEVIRRDSVGSLPEERSQRERLLNEIIIRTWGGDPASQNLRQVFASHQYEPPGVVTASADDPAWTAAIALAAGRGQPIAWMDDSLRSPNAVVSREDASEFAERLREIVAEQGYSYANLGDAIDTITICRAVAGKVNLPRPDNNEVEPAAMTDFLGRNEDGSRYAIVGWIFGDEVRSAYVAMCSLFLPRHSIALVNTYPGDGVWANWNVEPAGGMLAQRGFDVAVRSGERANERGWTAMIQNGITTDILAMNTKGNVDFFDLYGDERVTAFDVPLLNHPAVVHFTHSWSMRVPENETTIAGRFLANGAYGYVGSVQEPLLVAFIPPLALADRWANFAPLLVAARHWEDIPQLPGPWKVNTFGDPLMVAVPGAAAQNTKERIASEADYGMGLNDVVRATMRRIDEDESGVALADAIVLLELLGRDPIAVQLWRLAEQRGLSAQASRPALGPLFRAGEPEEFLRAWQETRGADARALDMLWHKVTPALHTIRDHDALLQMQSAIRRPHSQGDVSRLAPNLSRAFGKDHARQIIEREIDRTDNRRAQAALRQLLRAY